MSETLATIQSLFLVCNKLLFHQLLNAILIYTGTNIVLPVPIIEILHTSGGCFTNISIKLCLEWQPYLGYVKSYEWSALA